MLDQPTLPSHRVVTSRRRLSLARVGLFALILLAPLLARCRAFDPDRKLHIDLEPGVTRPARSVVIFFADGFDRTRMDDLLAQDRLPHIKRVFVDGGVRVDHAVSSMPSVTYPNCSAMITGLFPGHHDILGNFWLDRAELACRHYMTYETYRTVNRHLTRPTLYDVLGDRFTLNLQGHTRRGVTRTIENDMLFGIAWGAGLYSRADRFVGTYFERAADVANQLGRWPTVIMTYFPGVDETGHQFGPDSRDYAEALVSIDAVVGRVTDALEHAGLARDTYFILISDHGMAPIDPDHRVDLLHWLREERGLSLHTGDLDGADRARRLQRLDTCDAVAWVDAARVAMIHLSGRRGWDCRPEPDEVLAWSRTRPALHELPAVELVLTRAGPDRVHVLSRRGSAIIERNTAGGLAQYRLVCRDGDPLGYLHEPDLQSFVRAGWHRSREWLAATAAARCPDFAPQAVEMFDSPRTGDVVVMAAEGWGFNKRELGGHGSCLARDMGITLFFAGRGLPSGTSIDHARLVDLTPTVLGLLGESRRLDALPPLDGVDLTPQLRRSD